MSRKKMFADLNQIISIQMHNSLDVLRNLLHI